MEQSLRNTFPVPLISMPATRQTIQLRIVRPIALLLGVIVILVAILSSYLSTRILERSLSRQLDRIMNSMMESSFPLSVNVLNQMRQLSGAHFVVWNPNGELLSTTFPDGTGLEPLRPFLHTHSGAGRIIDTPAVSLGPDTYLAKVFHHAPPSREIVMILYPRNELASAQWRIASLPLLIGLVVLTGAILMTIRISGNLKTRLQLLQSQIDDIAGGDFYEVSSANQPAEIADLVESLNNLARQSLAMQELISRTERARVLGQLAGGLAHQMRNALTGTRMAIQIHSRRCITHKEEESLKVALQQLTVMEEHIKRLLSVGKGEQREVSWFHVRNLLHDVASLVEPVCKHSHVEIDQSLPTLRVLQIHGDYEGLRNALLNLVLNAIEAAGPGGKIEVRAIPEGNDLLFEILDNGPGPPAHIASRLFEPFVSGKPEGVGLGLAVVSQAVNLHQGTVMWERIAEKTCFRIRLPRIPSRMLSVDSVPAAIPTPDRKQSPENPLAKVSHFSE